MSIQFELSFDKAEFAQRLRVARKRARLTQGEVAAYIGLHPSAYNKWESLRANEKPKLDQIARLCEILKIDDPMSLLFGVAYGLSFEDTIPVLQRIKSDSAYKFVVRSVADLAPAAVGAIADLIKALKTKRPNSD